MKLGGSVASVTSRYASRENIKMFLTAKQADARLNSEKNLALKFGQSVDKVPQNEGTVTEKVIPLPGKNRINLTKDERTEIAIETRLGLSSQTEAARDKDLKVLTVHNITSGKTKGIDEEKVKEITSKARDLALERLMASLGLLSDDKLSGCSAKDLSVIASNMGRVVEKIQEKVETPDNINFIIYSPELKQERAYDVIEV
jgi:hypothetical protein